MTKECLWYNGEVGVYELLDFNPDKLTKQQIIHKAKSILFKEYGFTEWDKVLHTLYLIDVKDLKKVI